MKVLSQLVFTSLLSLAGCGGGDRVTPAPTVHDSGSATAPVIDPAPVAVAPPIATSVVQLPVEAPVVVTPSAAIPTTYKEALALGKKLAAAGDAQARSVLEAAALLDKKQAAPHIELARLFIAKSERANAIKSAAKAVKLAPESSQAHNTLGRAELLRHGYDAAIVAFQQATELDPENVWAWNNLGFVQLTLKQYEAAVTSLLTATSKPAATGYMWNNLGTAYEHLDQLDEARAAFAAGGTLGSLAAAQSRKRLEGVDTIVVAKVEKPVVTTYDEREPVVEDDVDDVPEPMAPVDAVEVEPMAPVHDADVPVDAGTPNPI